MIGVKDRKQVNWKVDPDALESWTEEAKERGFTSNAAYFNFIAIEHMAARRARIAEAPA